MSGIDSEIIRSMYGQRLSISWLTLLPITVMVAFGNWERMAFMAGISSIVSPIAESLMIKIDE